MILEVMSRSVISLPTLGGGGMARERPGHSSSLAQAPDYLEGRCYMFTDYKSVSLTKPSLPCIHVKVSLLYALSNIPIQFNYAMNPIKCS